MPKFIFLMSIKNHKRRGSQTNKWHFITVLWMLKMSEMNLGLHQVVWSRCARTSDGEWSVTKSKWRLSAWYVELPTWLSADLIPGRRSTLGWQNSCTQILRSN